MVSPTFGIPVELSDSLSPLLPPTQWEGQWIVWLTPDEETEAWPIEVSHHASKGSLLASSQQIAVWTEPEAWAGQLTHS